MIIFNVLCLLLWILLLQDKNSSRIRNSNYWPLGFICFWGLMMGWLPLISKILDYLHPDPKSFFLTMIGLILIVLIYLMIQLGRAGRELHKVKKEIRELTEEHHK